MRIARQGDLFRFCCVFFCAWVNYTENEKECARRKILRKIWKRQIFVVPLHRFSKDVLFVHNSFHLAQGVPR